MVVNLGRGLMEAGAGFLNALRGLEAQENRPLPSMPKCV